LSARLQQVVEELAGLGLRVELVLDQLGQDLPHERSVALVASVEAALKNVIAHAGVVHALVRATIDDGVVEVTVRDRGRGSMLEGPPASVATSVRDVGGEVAWWSAPGRGTRVTLRVPR
jgi:signal transduction histidine kinase